MALSAARMATLALLAAALPAWPAVELPSAGLPGPTPSDRDSLLCKLKEAVSFNDMTGVHRSSLRSFTPNPLATCAVVGSHGVLTLNEFGQDIDMADRVIRFNQAPTKGWESHVGSRNDIVVWNFTGPAVKPADAWETHPGVTYVQFPKSPQEFERAMQIRENDFEGVEFFIVWPDSIELAVREFMGDVYSEEWFPQETEPMWFHEDDPMSGAIEQKDRRFAPSTGTMGMVLALTMCGEVRAYAMASSRAELDESLPYHYWDNPGEGWPNTHTHTPHTMFSAERDFWRHVSNVPEEEIDATGTVVVTGFPALKCIDNSNRLNVSPFGSVITLQGGLTGKYCSDTDESAGSGNVECNSITAWDWEKFTIVWAGDGKFALLGGNKRKYCSVVGDEYHILRCDRDRIDGNSERFTMEHVKGSDPQHMRLKLRGGGTGKYCTDEGNMVNCSRDAVNDSMFFWMEVNGDTGLGVATS